MKHKTFFDEESRLEIFCSIKKAFVINLLFLNLEAM